jgi:hypothetical protein
MSRFGRNLSRVRTLISMGTTASAMAELYSMRIDQAHPVKNGVVRLGGKGG